MILTRGHVEDRCLWEDSNLVFAGAPDTVDLGKGLLIIGNSECSLMQPENHWLFFGSELSLSEFRPFDTQRFQMAAFLMWFSGCGREHRSVLRENLLFHLTDNTTKSRKRGSLSELFHMGLRQEQK